MTTAAGTALVTGAGSGIGRAVALMFLREGYKVAMAGRHLEKLEETWRRSGADADFVLLEECDVADERAVKRLFERIEGRFARLDVLFNNAGIGAPSVPIEDLSVDTWKRVVDINLTGAFLCTQAAVRLMKKQRPRGGRIINNGSISAQTPRPNSIAYTATKHGMTGLTKSTALDGRAFDIACGQINIGNAATELTERLAQGAPQPSGAIVPEPRMDLEHVAAAVKYMASLPLEANVLFLTVMATGMPFVGRG
jgi:NAD(P)-dependent dehydrogenase (short-subunit alcohol dehydrogenase family)